ncbi:MAG: hypothetical protein QOG65_622 [Actinomycetota bacterium]|nr:hypothetical protein [Actinomycetota bacterium]
MRRGTARLRGVVWFNGVAEDTENALVPGRLDLAPRTALEVRDDLSIFVVFERAQCEGAEQLRGLVMIHRARPTSFGSATIGVRILYEANCSSDDLGVRRPSLLRSLTGVAWFLRDRARWSCGERRSRNGR